MVKKCDLCGVKVTEKDFDSVNSEGEDDYGNDDSVKEPNRPAR